MKHLFIFILIIASINAKAQDPVFSQAFNAPLTLNPATAGTAEMDLRFTATYKRHYININSAMQYAAVGVDKYVPKLHGGVGLLATGSSEGYLNKAGLHVIYSYALCLNNARLHLGLQAGMVNRSVQSSKLIFSPQLDNTGVIDNSSPQLDGLVNNKKFYADFASGFLLFWGEHLMLGGGAQHISEPDESLTSNIYSRLPIRWFGYTRYKLYLDEPGYQYMLPSIIVYKQDNWFSYSLGLEYKDARVGLGAWYRGNIKGKNAANLPRSDDAFIVTVSIDLFNRYTDNNNRMRIGMGYDATVGKLTSSRSAGSSEAAFVWEKLTANGVPVEDRCNGELEAKPRTGCPVNVY